MKTKFVIGKGENGKNVDIVVSQGCAYVSRFHAELKVEPDGVVTIEDLDSTNGTFVNGRRIISQKLKRGDVVMLGSTGGGGYKLDWEPIVGRLSGGGDRVDYTKEFLQLENIYADYLHELEKVKQSDRRRQVFPRLIVTLVLVAVGVVLMSEAHEPMIGGLPMLAGVLAQLIPVKSTKANEQIVDLKVKYASLYKCPKCGKPYSLESSALHPKMLRANKVCPYNCGAIFVKD